MPDSLHCSVANLYRTCDKLGLQEEILDHKLTNSSINKAITKQSVATAQCIQLVTYPPIDVTSASVGRQIWHSGRTMDKPAPHQLKIDVEFTY